MCAANKGVCKAEPYKSHQSMSCSLFCREAANFPEETFSKGMSVCNQEYMSLLQQQFLSGFLSIFVTRDANYFYVFYEASHDCQIKWVSFFRIWQFYLLLVCKLRNFIKTKICVCFKFQKCDKMWPFIGGERWKRSGLWIALLYFADCYGTSEAAMSISVSTIWWRNKQE